MKQQLLQTLQPYGQQHLLAFWDNLSTADRQRLAEQIHAVDFELIGRLARQAQVTENWADLAARAVPPRALRLDADDNEFSVEQAAERGRRALSAGQVGVVLVAGGQGTRLGFNHPKGMFPIGPVSGATLFQILIEKLLAAAGRHRTCIPLYLMTSPATHHQTVDFLDEHDGFGLPAEDLTIFCQGTMPAVDAQSGRLLLSAPGRLALGPDGHGGTLAALRNSGSLDDIQQRGIEQLFYMQVDNPLVDVCDAAFIGYHLLCQSEASTQVVAKRDPEEPVGVVVEIDGREQILEYSDIPREAAERRASDGSLELWAGNIAVHVFDVAFFDRMSQGAGKLPFHRAKKKVPYVGEAGQIIEPPVPNAVKFERFIFDLLPEARRAIVVEVDPATHFAPLKNAPGARRDSPERVRRQMLALYTDWLRQAGAEVADGVAVEISPLFASDAEQMAEKIEPGRQFDRDTYLR